MSEMAKLEFGRLTEAWKGEASDFTPLLAAQLDAIGMEIGVNLESFGATEVHTSGGRRIDIVAQDEDGLEFVVENQYGRGDHDHLTRGLAYAVARRARGLVVIAEEHRDEFRALAQYLNDLADLDRDRGIAVWLVEAKAVRIESGPWAPLFSTVVEPNAFTATVEQTRKPLPIPASLEEFWGQFQSPSTLAATQSVLTQWLEGGYRRRLAANHIVFQAPGPSKNGLRTVVAVYDDGTVMVPFASFAGANSGIAVEPLTTSDFRSRADQLFGFRGDERLAKTTPGWLSPETTRPFLNFCQEIASAYATALDS